MTRHRSTPLPILIALLLVAAQGVLLAQPEPRVYEFLRNDASARAAAMGGAFVTVMDDAASMYYNPATITTVDSTQLAFSFKKNLLDINSGFATFATTFDGIGKVGIGVDFNSNGSFERTDKMGRSLGEFGANDVALSLVWGSVLGEGFSAGLGGKAIFTNIDEYNSFGLALDGGVFYNDTARRFQAGLSILNLGAQVSSYGIESEQLPIDAKLGISHQVRGLPLLIALNFNRLFDQPGSSFFSRFGSFAIGGEFRISQPLRLRFGYNNRVREDVAFSERTGLSGFSAGFGVVVKGYRFDYALNRALGSLHHISVSAMF